MTRVGHLDDIVLVIVFDINRIRFFSGFIGIVIRRVTTGFTTTKLHYILHTQRTRLMVRQPLFNTTEMVIMSTPTDLSHGRIYVERILTNTTSFHCGTVGFH